MALQRVYLGRRNIGIERADFTPHGRQQRRGVTAGLRHQCRPWAVTLKNRAPEKVGRLLTQMPIFAILHYADDFISLLILSTAHRETVSHRIAVRPEAARHLFIDDDHSRRALSVTRGEFAP